MIVGRMRLMTFSLCIFFAIDICLGRRIPKVRDKSGVGGLPEMPSKNAKGRITRDVLSRFDEGGLPEIPSKNAKDLSPEEDWRIRNFGKSKVFGNSAFEDEEDVSEFFLPTNPEIPEDIPKNIPRNIPEDIPEDREPSDLEYDQPRINPKDYEEIDRENDIGEDFHGNDSEPHDDYGNRDEEPNPSLNDYEASDVDYKAVVDKVDEEQDSEVGKSAEDKSGEDTEMPHVAGDGFFESAFFNYEQMMRYLKQLDRAVEKVFRQTEEDALKNGAYTNTTEEEVNIDGHKYKVHKSIIKTGDKNSSIFFEAVESVAEPEIETNRTKRSNWYSADAQTAKDSDP